jgi:PAS domain S-box-containing protein
MPAEVKKKGTKVAKNMNRHKNQNTAGTVDEIRTGVDEYKADAMKTMQDKGDPEKERLLKRIEELESLNRDLLGMVENSFDGLAIQDGDTRLLMLNPAFYKIMGFENIPCLGRTTREMVQEGTVDNSAGLKVVETGKSQTVIINTISGRQVLSTGVPVFDQHGKIQRIYCNLRDITELNSLKEKYEESLKLVSKYLIELQEARKRTDQSQFIAHSQCMKQIIESVYWIARVDATVLILGESGVGKDLIARIIHNASPRKETGLFVKINCGAIPAELLESELFGYETGAFTGASKEGKPGYFELAHKGTIFLDEIGDLPLKLQVKLLSVIQDQEVTRIGGTKSKKVDTRIIAATNQDLEKMLETGKFREDLYYRLNVVPILIPPLRERSEEIPFLLIHFLERYNKKYNLRTRMSKELVSVLSDYKWPGNVRELANLMEHLVVVANEEFLKPEHLPEKYLSGGENAHFDLSETTSFHKAMETFESKIIKAALAQCSTLEEAAHKLGISMSSLTRKKKRLSGRI